jgi:transcriptional regulator with XRE-family HTH domain
MIEPTHPANGPRIKSLREKKRWTQKEFAIKVGCNKRTIEHAEAGHRIKESYLTWIADTLEVPFREIVAEAAPDVDLERDVSGSWVGHECQAEGLPGKRARLPVALELKSGSRRSLSGEYVITFGKSRFTFDIQGELCFGRFVKFDYRSTDRGAVRFGSYILALNDDGDELVGHGVGYSAFGGRVTTATISLRRPKRRT